MENQINTSSLKAKGTTTFLFYILMVLLAVGAFTGIQTVGERVAQRAAGFGSAAHAPHPDLNLLLHFLLALATVIVVARAIGGLFYFLGQPPVIGEVIGGILLGPSLFGRVAPQFSAYVLPPSAIPFLGIISQLGVIIYMFLVGLELDLKVLRKSGHATLAISHASIICPFLLGGALAIYLYPTLAMGGVSFTVFALFLGVSMSVTAFPVLARILTDRKVSKTRMGVIALTCAAVDDATAWCLLAFVVSISQADQIGGALSTVGLTIGYIAIMFIGVRPLIARVIPLVEKLEVFPKGAMAVVLVGLLVSSLITEYIGIHAIFGAFLLGAIIPHNSRVASELTQRLEDIVSILFLPAFFAFTGMRTQVALVSTQEQWMMCGLIILVATVGKFGGSLAAAKLTGLGWRDSASLGILMNTRGLVELIVLNLGLDLGVISPTLFTMLVIMALVTTFMTSPALQLLTKNHPWTE
jgi:Kef-type K+ transport system membrane component KefB